MLEQHWMVLVQSGWLLGVPGGADRREALVRRGAWVVAQAPLGSRWQVEEEVEHLAACWGRVQAGALRRPRCPPGPTYTCPGQLE